MCVGTIFMITLQTIVLSYGNYRTLVITNYTLVIVVHYRDVNCYQVQRFLNVNEVDVSIITGDNNQ